MIGRDESAETRDGTWKMKRLCPSLGNYLRVSGHRKPRSLLSAVTGMLILLSDVLLVEILDKRRR